MYKRYVDDINVIVGVVEPGAKIAGTTDKESKAQDSHRNKDEMCMELLREVGNRIHKSIQIEVDYPSRHGDNLMPILDLKVWIARKNVIMNGKDCTVNVVLHEFYAKEVSSKMMLSSRSALPMKVKRTVLTQEVLRVLLNCNPEIPWEQTVGHVNNMMRRMQYSGYSKGFRYEIVQSGLLAYKKIQELDQTGVKPMYRPKEWRQNEGRKEKEEKRRSWYRKGNYSSVIFVPATPESSLKRSSDEDVKKSGLRIRMVEKSGMSVKRVLQRSDPFKKITCERMLFCVPNWR